MRPPKEEWSKAVDAIDALLNLSRAQMGKDVGVIVRAYVIAEDKVRDFREHIESAEECEMD